MKLRIRIDRDVCIGSENCVRYAPDTFETDAQCRATLKPGSADTEQMIRVAVESCPVGALSIDETDSAERS